jgi:hypothetical protein
LEGLTASLPDPARIIEIGTYEGNSLVAMLRGLAHHEDAHIWTIDLSDRTEADDTVAMSGLAADRYTRIVRGSFDVAQNWDEGPVDLVFVDGDHSESGVRSDIRAWSPHVKVGGLMVFDDFQTPNYTGSTKAVNALMFHSGGWRKVGQVGRCVAFEKLGGVADWQADIGAWKTFWPTAIDWKAEPLSEEAWICVNYGWQWRGYPELPASQWQARGQDPPTDPIDTKATEDLTEEELASLSEKDKAIRGLEYSETIYDREWFSLQRWQHPWIEKMIGWLVGEFGPFERSLDLGAGDGYYSYALREVGTLAYAVEVSDEAAEFTPEEVWLVVWDLRNPLHLEETYDLVLCVEVAEHLPENAADTLCDTITRHASSLVVFTAAPPNQGGHGHVNLQPPEYWIGKLGARGLTFLEHETARIRRAYLNILGESLPWLSKNVMLFRKDGA